MVRRFASDSFRGEGDVGSPAKKASAQLATTARSHGLAERFFRWAYQAKVMNTLLQVSSSRVVNAGFIGACRAVDVARVI